MKTLKQLKKRYDFVVGKIEKYNEEAFELEKEIANFEPLEPETECDCGVGLNKDGSCPSCLQDAADHRRDVEEGR